MMGDVGVLAMFVFALFGILGMYLFSGNTRQFCHMKNAQGIYVVNEDYHNNNENGFTLCQNTTAGATNPFACPAENVCLMVALDYKFQTLEFPGNGVTGFDNFVQATVNIIQCASLEGWVDTLYLIYESNNLGYFIGTLYFMFLVLLIAFLLLELITGVVYVAYQVTVERDEEEQAAKKAREERREVELQEVKDNQAITSAAVTPKNDPTVTSEDAEASPPKYDVVAAVAPEDSPEEEKGELTEEKKWEKLAEERLAMNPLVATCYKMAKSHTFDITFITAIVINTLFMASEHHEQPEYWEQTLEIANYVFTVLFTLESFIKLIGFGCKGFTYDSFNLFDAFVVVVSWVDIIVSSFNVDGGGFAALRAFRVVRLFKLASQWKALQKLLRVIGRSLMQLSSFCVLLILFMYIFALMGMSFFAGNFGRQEAEFGSGASLLNITNSSNILYNEGNDVEEPFRYHFDNLFFSFLTVFVIIGGENWNEVLYQGYKASGGTTGSGWLAYVYFVPLFLMGQYMLLNLFLSIVLSNNEEDDDDEEGSAEAEAKKKEREEKGKEMNNTETEKYILKGKSLFLLGPENGCRLFVKKIIENPLFDAIILFFIILSTLFLAFSVEEGSTFYKFLVYFGVTATVIFLGELFCKVIVMGFVIGPNTYLRDPWNVLDFLIVLISLIDLGALISNVDNNSLGWLKAFRALRALRPLRMVRRYESLMVVVTSLFKVLPPVTRVLGVSLFFYMVFGIIAINLFKGTYYQCEFSDGTRLLTVGKDQCRGMINGQAVTWKNADVANFDDIFWSVLTLFEVASMEMWPDVMFRAQDINTIGSAPIVEHQPYVYSFFFIIFIIVGAFFINSLFVGAVVDTFTEVMNSATGRALLTNDQKKWMEVQRMFVNVKPAPKPRPDPPGCRGSIARLAKSTKFEAFIALCILLNVIVMGMVYTDADANYVLAMRILNYIFGFIFFVEMCIKFLAFGCYYFSDAWNCFDFFIVMSSIVDLIFELMDGGVQLDFLKLLRVFRALRMLRLVKRAKGLQQMLRTLAMAMPAFINVGSLLLLLHFVYAVAGMALFSELPTDKEFLNYHANFKTFGVSMLTLFRMTTGESYNGIMHDCMYLPNELCVETDDNKCGNGAAIAYFLSFVILSQFMILSLFVAAVLEEFESSAENDFGKNRIDQEDLEEYHTLWQKHEPKKVPTKVTCWSKVENFFGTQKAKDEIMPWVQFQKVIFDLKGHLAPDPTGDDDLKDLHVPTIWHYYDESVYEKDSSIDDLVEQNQTKGKGKTGNGITPQDNRTIQSVHYIDGMLALGKHFFKKQMVEDGDNFKDIPEDSVMQMKNIQKKMGRKYKLWDSTPDSNKETITITPRESRSMRNLLTGQGAKDGDAAARTLSQNNRDLDMDGANTTAKLQPVMDNEDATVVLGGEENGASSEVVVAISGGSQQAPDIGRAETNSEPPAEGEDVASSPTNNEV